MGRLVPPLDDAAKEKIMDSFKPGGCIQDKLTELGAAPIYKPGDEAQYAPHKKPLDRNRFIAEFRCLCDEMLTLTVKKNNDYGGPVDPLKNFRRHGEYGIVVRMDDKMARLESFFKEKRALAVEDEKITDTAMDLAVYALILIVMHRDSQ